MNILGFFASIKAAITVVLEDCKVERCNNPGPFGSIGQLLVMVG
jgi:hypothetical protein